MSKRKVKRAMKKAYGNASIWGLAPYKQWYVNKCVKEIHKLKYGEKY